MDPAAGLVGPVVRDVPRHDTVGLTGLEPADVERRTLERWRPGDPSWLTAMQVAAMLGVSQPRVSQLARRGFLPYERTPDGRRRLYRPAQVAVIARARRERFHAEEPA